MLTRESLQPKGRTGAPITAMAVEIVTCDATGTAETARHVKMIDLLAPLSDAIMPEAASQTAYRPQPRLG